MKLSFFKFKPSYKKEVSKIEKQYSKMDKSKETLLNKKLDLLKIDLKYNKLTEIDYEKAVYDAKELPWAKFHLTYNEEVDPDNMQTELVYNEYFIKKLENLGYSGESQEDIIQAWLSQVFAANVDPTDLIDTNNEYVKNKKVNNTFIVG